MKRSEFHYDLPAGLIAQEPRERGRSRMMVVTPRAGEHPQIEHASFASFPSLLDSRDVLVLNDTRVIPARLYADLRGAMQRRIEILLTRQLDERTWETWCKPAKRIRTGDVLTFGGSSGERAVAGETAAPLLAGTIMAKQEDGTIVIRFEGDPDAVAAAIEAIGVPPLPPYIERAVPRESDRDAYQTVYASARGAIAAPTAGLHFTPAILDDVARRGVEIVRVTLHVGIGTFKPVKADDLAEHRMDSERYEITPAAASSLNTALRDGCRIVAVGTTSVRTLESAIRAGDGEFRPGPAETSLFITPGFEFRATHRLLTNFHLPESTLLMLVSAFAGTETIRAAYRSAIENRYYFYSYGDCMLLSRSTEY